MFGRKGKGGTAAVTSLYQVRQRMVAVGDDFWIENGVGEKVYRVNGKALRVRKTFSLEDRDGTELLKIRSRLLRVRRTFAIERDGETVATLHKKVIGFRDRFSIDLGDAGDLRVQGRILDHDYAIRRGNRDIAQVSKAWARIRDTYGVSIVAGEDVPLLLAVVICVDAISHADR